MIAVLGLTFKPNTDDMRDAHSISLVTALEDARAIVGGYDPEGMEQARQVLPELQLAENAYDCLAGAEAMVIATEWNEFRALDLPRVKTSLASPVVVDLRNIYRPENVARMGFAMSASVRVISLAVISQRVQGHAAAASAIGGRCR
jgi:UDPglucose 6-dehydrogenase